MLYFFHFDFFISFRVIKVDTKLSKVVLLLFIYCLIYLPLFFVVLCWSLFWYALLCVPSSFAIILTRKREVAALLLLSFGCLVTVNVL